MIIEQALGLIFALTSIVQEINTLLNLNSNVLLIAPTGWGKTTLLLDLVKNSEKTWVYLAPLRALANEFYIRSSKAIKGTILISHHYEVQEMISSGLKTKLLIITPELLSEKLIQYFKIGTNYVFDELHLFYYWGGTFRPKLIECYEDVLSTGNSCLSLSATMSDELVKRWEIDGRLNSERTIKINLNNHTLKKDPRETTYIPKPFAKLFMNELIFKKTRFSKLIFCAYKDEVMSLKNRLEGLGFCVVTCIGGQTQLLAGELSRKPKPDFILATSAASHGVNLPKISIIYLSYKIKNYDFWVQMCGRGGRQGEEFRVFTRDKYRITTIGWLLSFLYLLKLKLWSKLYPYELRRYLNSQNSL
tara:strand:- start:502 stop:1584 length:1083 start_codon:yes stop_codon:yes gene_type:complete